MNNKVRLPFKTNPLSVMYHNLAFPLGVIEGNAKCDITPWLCHKFINCIFNSNVKNKFSISLSDNWGISEQINFCQQMHLYFDSYNKIGIDIIQMLKAMLVNGYYVNGDYNEEYVPGKQAYGIEYFPHDYLLIGFDDEKEVFNSVGYLTKQLVNFEIPYKNMELALKTLKSNKPILNFYKYNTDKDFKVDVNKIISGLKDYISSSNSTQHHAQGFFYGLEAVIRLGEHIINDGEKSNFDHRYTRGLMEHKHIMVKRIEYLCNNQYLSNNKCIYSAYRVFEYAKIIHNLGIRFKLLRDQNLLKEIMAIIQKMKNIELEYLASVKGELELFDT